MMTSSTSPGSILARSMAALIAVAPSSWAGVLAKAPLNEPTAVRAAETITTSVILLSLCSCPGKPPRVTALDFSLDDHGRGGVKRIFRCAALRPSQVRQALAGP